MVDLEYQLKEEKCSDEDSSARRSVTTAVEEVSQKKGSTLIDSSYEELPLTEQVTVNEPACHSEQLTCDIRHSEEVIGLLTNSTKDTSCQDESQAHIICISQRNDSLENVGLVCNVSDVQDDRDVRVGSRKSQSVYEFLMTTLPDDSNSNKEHEKYDIIKSVRFKLATASTDRVIKDYIMPQVLSVSDNIASQALTISGNIGSSALLVTDNIESQVIKISENTESQSLPVSDNTESQSLTVSDHTESRSLTVSDNVESQALTVSDHTESQPLPISENIDSQSLTIKNNIELQSLEFFDTIEPQSLIVPENIEPQSLTESKNVELPPLTPLSASDFDCSFQSKDCSNPKIHNYVCALQKSKAKTDIVQTVGDSACNVSDISRYSRSCLEISFSIDEISAETLRETEMTLGMLSESDFECYNKSSQSKIKRRKLCKAAFRCRHEKFVISTGINDSKMSTEKNVQAVLLEPSLTSNDISITEEKTVMKNIAKQRIDAFRDEQDFQETKKLVIEKESLVKLRPIEIANINATVTLEMINTIETATDFGLKSSGGPTTLSNISVEIVKSSLETEKTTPSSEMELTLVESDKPSLMSTQGEESFSLPNSQTDKNDLQEKSDNASEKEGA